MSAPRLSLAYPRLWRPNTVPTFPVVLDRTHDLVVGCTTCLVFGAPSYLMDLSPSANNATPVGSPPLVSAARGGALSFNGTTQYLNLANTGAVNSPARSYSALIYPPSVSVYVPILGDENSSGGPSFRIGNDGRLQWVQQGQALVANSTNAVSAGVWSHVAMTYDAAGNSRFYINGQDAGNTAPSIGTFAPGGARIAYDGYGTLLANALISTLTYHNRVLSPSEVALLAAEPFAMLRSVVPRMYFVANTSTSISGTLTVTGASGTLVASAASTVSGTLTATGSSGSLASSASVKVSGTLTATGSSGALSANASAVVNGTLSVTGASGSISASGSVKVSGSLTQSGQDGTLVASGTAASASILGTLNITGQSGSISSSANVSVSGTLTATGSGTLSASGTVSAIPATGTLTANGANGTLAAVAVAVVSGVLTVSGSNGTVSANATISISGSLAKAGSNGTLVASGTSSVVIPFNLAANVVSLSAELRTVDLDDEARLIKVQASIRLLP